MKVIYVDFDGVLNSYKTPFTTAGDLPDPPVPGAIEWLRELNRKFRVFIYTTRMLQADEAEPAIAVWLCDNGMPMHEVDQLGFTVTKRGASVYIDDRAMRFDGENYPTVQELDDFKPWNKR